MRAAFLRGVNVGGKGAVEMRRLAEELAALGLADVRTLLASGNVVFRGGGADRAALAARIEAVILAAFGVVSPVVLRERAEVRALAEAIPATWTNDAEQRCEVLLLRDGLDAEAVVAGLVPRAGVDEVLAVPGAIVWRFARADAGRTALRRVLVSPVYAELTIRNVTTVRRVAAALEAL